MNIFYRLYLCIALVSPLYATQERTSKKTGIDQEIAKQFLKNIAPIIAQTSKPGAEIGEHIGLFDMSTHSYTNPQLVSSMNGVGTKLKIAQAMNNHTVIGADLVALCANDLLARGGEPLFFLNYLGTGQLDLAQGEQIIQGIAQACTQSHCTRIGGETAQAPGVYRGKEYDLAGCMVGAVERDHLLPQKETIQSGDAIIGLPSSGVHTHGFSLIRNIINENGYDLHAQSPFPSTAQSFGNALLQPTTLYTPSVLPLCKQGRIKAVAHTVSGGIIQSLSNALPEHLEARIDFANWHIPAVFRWLKHVANIADHEMAQTFNCGIGMALIVSPNQSTPLIDDLEKQGMHAFRIGTVSPATHPERVQINGTIPIHAMKVLVVGGGAREHAIAWKLAQSPYVGLVLVAPGNAGTAQEPKLRNLPINPYHTNALITYAKQQGIDLVLVGPGQPLADGFSDACRKKGLRCFAPSHKAAQLESSQLFAKQFMERHGIATPSYQSFTHFSQAEEYITAQPLPLVIHADGRAESKEAVVAHTHEEACNAARSMLGTAGNCIIIEQYLAGHEINFVAITDGKTALPCATSQDHKKRNDGDRGPNTEGMGAYSPAPMVTLALHEQIMHDIVEPTIKGMRHEGNPFTGFLSMRILIHNNTPYVLEYSCHLGDPEAQSLMMRLKSDLFVLCDAAMDYRLDQASLVWDDQPALSVVIADEGYPDRPHKGDVIAGMPEGSSPDCKLFHGATTYNQGNIVTNGGRVLCATARGHNLRDARNAAYRMAQSIFWPTAQYRKDIGYNALNTHTS